MRRSLLLMIFVSFMLQPLLAQIKIARNPWPAITKEMRPWTRWWWMGSAVEEKNLAKLLELYQHAGFGGMEITPIYGAKEYENRYVSFLSPHWMKLLDFTVKKATSLGMGIDMNTGTGWPFGGPQVTPDLAAAKLIIKTYPLKGGQKFYATQEINDTLQSKLRAPLQAVTAVSDAGERIPLPVKVGTDQQLDWTAPPGNWTVYAAFSGKTGQLVKRAAPGGEGLVMDHYSRDAVSAYLKRFTTAFHKQPVGINAFFNDSYEVYIANWTPRFFDAFKQTKGYDLSLYLKELSGAGDTAVIARIKSDYNEVLGQMLQQDFTAQWTDWTHQRGAKARNQAHGSPGNLLDLYGVPDIPETEAFFGRTKFLIPGLERDTADIVEDMEHNPVMFKFASSAAHFYNKPIISSETFVWLTEHFRTALSQCKPEVEQLFLAGINHVFFHGSTYSPEDVPWPGWTFYASTNFVPTNSTWPHLKGMNDYITRCQSVLQSGRADNQLMVYWPVYDQWNDPDGMEKRFSMHGVESWLYPTAFNKLVKTLEHTGYSTDFVSDKMIGLIATGKTPVNAKVLVVPACRFMPVKTLENILKIAKKGATVIFQSLPEDVPGYASLDNKRRKFKSLLAEIMAITDAHNIKQKTRTTGKLILETDVPEALQAAKLQREELTDLGLQFIRREMVNGKYYYIVNHTAKPVDRYVPLNVKSGAALIMDPQTGSVGRAASIGKDGRMNVRLQLQPGEAIIIRTYNSGVPTYPAWQYFDKTGAVQNIDGEWSLHFTEGGPELPADQKVTQLRSWTRDKDPKAIAFSGTGSYTNTFTISSLTADEYLLQLGEVKESAHLWINGKDAGILWGVPFQKRIREYLRPGLNTIKIEVANLMANRIIDMDKKGIKWRNYHEINFVNIHYQPFDASRWTPLRSGLLGPVTITAITYDSNNGSAKKE